MFNWIKKIRTQSGDAQIDYESLANLPVPDKTLTQEGKAADAKEVGDRLGQLSDEIANQVEWGVITEGEVFELSTDEESSEPIPCTSITLDKTSFLTSSLYKKFFP